MNIKLFVENNSNRPDTVGKVCRTILEDEHMKWNCTNREIMDQFNLMRRSAGLHQRAMNRFFKELKNSLQNG